jgi:hypothetical protein
MTQAPRQRSAEDAVCMLQSIYRIMRVLGIVAKEEYALNRNVLINAI